MRGSEYDLSIHGRTSGFRAPVMRFEERSWIVVKLPWYLVDSSHFFFGHGAESKNCDGAKGWQTRIPRCRKKVGLETSGFSV